MPRKQWVDFAKVRAALTMPDVLLHYGINHQSNRAQIKVHCPFHEDSTPSCSINLEEHKFKRFGREANGNALDFAILMEGGDTTKHEDRHEAARVAVLEIIGDDLANFGKGEAEDDNPANSGRVKAKPKKTATPKDESVSSASTPAENAVFDRVLKLDHEHSFLAERGIEPDVAEEFGIGYCSKGIMKNRIAFPIHRPSGECVGYVGRWADEEVPEDTVRYAFPKGFHKSLELWNIHRALTLEKKFLVLVEGYWSAIRLHRLGIPVVALMGTSVSEEQAQMIRDLGYKFAILLLDGDDAGRNATKEASFVLSQHVYVRSIALPDGEKPDSVEEGFLSQFT